MSRKGLSMDEKKARMVQLLYEKKEFFQLKELEKMAPKEKGITANSVKDVVQALVDDGTVDTDKVGGSIYFWAFPGKLLNAKKRKLQELQNSLESSSKKLKVVAEKVQTAKEGKEDLGEAKEIMKEIEDLKAEKSRLETEYKTLKENDPEMLGQMKAETQPVKEAANRWTDNIFAVKSWCKKKFMIEDSVLNKQFGIPEDLDYIE